MPHTPIIDIRALRKTGVLNEDRFFQLLSQQCNYIEPQTLKDIYMGLVRHLTKELRENGIVRLPHLGDVALVKQNPAKGFIGRFYTSFQGKYLLKFYPKVSWRQYFQKLSEKDGREGALDPREKLLNRKLQDTGII